MEHKDGPIHKSNHICSIQSHARPRPDKLYGSSVYLWPSQQQSTVMLDEHLSLGIIKNLNDHGMEADRSSEILSFNCLSWDYILKLKDRLNQWWTSRTAAQFAGCIILILTTIPIPIPLHFLCRRFYSIFCFFCFSLSTLLFSLNIPSPAAKVVID